MERQKKSVNRGNDGRGLLLPLFCSLFACLPFFLYAPISVYLANAEEFIFTLADFAIVPVVCFLLAAAVFFGVGCLIKGRALSVYCAVLFALGFLSYIQGSFLLKDTGVLNGMPYDPSAHTAEITANCMIWAIVIALCIIFAVRGKKAADRVFKYASGIMSAFLLVALAVLLISAKGEYFEKRSSFVSSKGLLDASEEDSFILIVPDMFDRTYMDTILAESPETALFLDGFTYYPHVRGCYSSTKESIPAFLSDPELMSALEKGGFETGIYTDSRFIPEILREDSVNVAEGTAHISDIPAFTAVLYRLAACSYAPDVLRGYVWLYGNEFDELYTAEDSRYSVYTISNISFMDALKQNGITVSPNNVFRMIHLYGSHYPYVTDENLNPIAPSFSDENAVKASRGVLEILYEYISALKRAGIYDKTMIVVMADHGYTVPGEQTDPLLMIRLPGDYMPFSISDEEVPQERIPAMLASMVEECMPG